MESRKIVQMNLPQSRNKDTDVEKKHGHQVGEGGRGGINWETGIDTFTLLIICIEYITNENLRYSSGNSASCCGDLNGKVLLGRDSQGQRSVAGYSPWCYKSQT